MQEERVFPEETNDETSSQNSQEESEDEEFFDPLPYEENLQETQTPPPLRISQSKKKAMIEFRCRVEDAILSNNIYGKSNRGYVPGFHQAREDLRDIKIFGVPLLPSRSDEFTDTVLMKFLKAGDYRGSEALYTLRKAMKWRKEHKIDGILDEEFSPEHNKMWCLNGRDRESRPVFYYMLGCLESKEMRHRFLGTEERYEEFTRWRIQGIERGIRGVLSKDGCVISSIIQIVDLQNAPAAALKEVDWIQKRLLTLIHENYPGIVYKNIVINVPFWFMAFHALHLRLLTQRSRNKVIFVGPTRVTETLLKFITPENIPLRYGGLKRDDDAEFSTNDRVLYVSVKANSKKHIRIPAPEADVTVTWDLTVVGFEVTYTEEFVPDDDCSYRVLVQQEKKMSRSIRNFFHIREPGNIVITIDNGTFKKRKAFYRYKSKPSIPLYMANNNNK